MKLFRTLSIKSCLISAFVFLFGVFGGCAPTVHCPRGEYIEFGIDFIQGINYSASLDHLDIWLTTKRTDKKSRECLPEDISVQNMSAPEVCDLSFFRPAYIKGRPLMALYVYNVSQIKKNEFIEFDLYQKNVKKQTVRISVDFVDTSKVIVTVNGNRIVADRVR